MPTWEALVVPPGPPAGDAIWWCVQGSRVALGPDGSMPSGPEPPEGADTFEGLFLGRLDGVECWAAGLGREAEIPEGTTLMDLRAAYGILGERRWAIAGRAVQLLEWDRTNRFCGACATPTELAPGERAKRCPSCGLLAFPRLAPAIITLVTRGDEALLGQGVNFGVPMYSCLAGFVEPGETLEEAVAREVREEVGVEIADIRYQRSQPWPFPHSLMLGFRAEWAGGEIEVDPVEIVDAKWFTRDDLPMVPPGLSIARTLIDDWLRG
jgi:NAD+ diphosphatase